MRQVPDASPHYLIIGNGRVARHFLHYFSLLSLSYSHWHRQDSPDILQQQIKSATHILLLISDGAIEDFILKNLQNTNACLIHCSGSLSTVLAFGAHPLMTFSKDLYADEQYHSIPFVIDDDAPDFKELFPGLPNRQSRLPKNLKAKYHAFCVLSGNFSCMLWQKLFNGLDEELNLPSDFAIPYFLQQTQNILNNPKTALTGPLVRNDIRTIEKNLAALDGDPFQDIYKSFVTCYRKLQEEVANERTGLL
jgi:2-dehydropantoate 2-reductase